MKKEEPQKRESPWKRGECHQPNPTVNRARRPQILAKRIRNIERRMRDLRDSVRYGGKASRLQKKLTEYRMARQRLVA